MSVIHYVDWEDRLSGGKKMIGGKLNLSSSYAADGDPLNLQNYLKSSDVPQVIISSGGGYVLEHNNGTVAAGTIKAFQNVLNATTVNGTAANSALYEVHTGADLSAVNVPFIAIADPF